MNLLNELEESISALCEGIGEKELSKAAEELTSNYKSEKSHQTDFHRMVYLCTRMPATYAVLCRIFKEFSVPETVIDCGAGPGTSLWALPNKKITLIEQDLSFIKIGKKLFPKSSAKWKHQTFYQFKERAEMVLFSYSLNEIPGDKLRTTIKNAFYQTENLITIIEPGTPKGFQNILKIREQLLELGMFILAPCTHCGLCPMEKKNWCHFSVRLPRTALHRRIKKGMLGFEDEKFSYIVASKKPFFQKGKRVMRHPKKNKGFVVLDLCSDSKLFKKSVTKNKKIKWGDLIT